VRRLFLVPIIVSSTLGLAACSTSSSSSSSSGVSTGAHANGPPGQAPAVANATNLQTAPVVSAGAPPAPTALSTVDLVVGTGTTAAATSTVVVQYVGANYADGRVFDSSWQRGSSATFPLNGVIPGFAQGIVGMKVGGRREIVIPPSEGYGAQGSPPAVGPDETLVFVVDLISVQ
jgi:peptidylprolyl isomerase